MKVFIRAWFIPAWFIRAWSRLIAREIEIKWFGQVFFGTGVTERNKKNTVAKVSRLRLPLRFSSIVPTSRSPEELFKSWGEVSVLSLPLRQTLTENFF